MNSPLILCLKLALVAQIGALACIVIEIINLTSEIQP